MLSDRDLHILADEELLYKSVRSKRFISAQKKKEKLQRVSKCGFFSLLLLRAPSYSQKNHVQTRLKLFCQLIKYLYFNAILVN